jgi:hypothetical protein
LAQQVDKEIDDHITANDERLRTPTECFITFEHEVGYDAAIDHFKKKSTDFKLLGHPSYLK